MKAIYTHTVAIHTHTMAVCTHTMAVYIHTHAMAVYIHTHAMAVYIHTHAMAVYIHTHAMAVYKRAPAPILERCTQALCKLVKIKIVWRCQHKTAVMIVALAPPVAAVAAVAPVAALRNVYLTLILAPPVAPIIVVLAPLVRGPSLKKLFSACILVLNLKLRTIPDIILAEKFDLVW